MSIILIQVVISFRANRKFFARNLLTPLSKFLLVQMLVELGKMISAFRRILSRMKGRRLVCIDMGTVTGIPGHWVLVVQGEVIASSEDAGEMLRLAENYPDKDTYVTKILYPGASFY